MDKQEYIGCWYCDNIIDHPEQVGLLYLGFPRCMILIPNSEEFMFQDFDDFRKTAKVNWLDPSDIDRYSENEKENIIITLWNFCAEQERKEDEILK